MYAPEFTATGEYPNRTPDIKKAKELYNFICENVKLPDVETDQLSNSLNSFTSIIERLSEKKKEETPSEDEKEQCVGLPGEEGPYPSRSALWNLYDCIKAHILAVGLKPHKGEGSPAYTREVFRFDGLDEFLQVTLEHSAKPI